jgi:hypothetical protein
MRLQELKISTKPNESAVAIAAIAPGESVGNSTLS